MKWGKWKHCLRSGHEGSGDDRAAVRLHWGCARVAVCACHNAKKSLERLDFTVYKLYLNKEKYLEIQKQYIKETIWIVIKALITLFVQKKNVLFTHIIDNDSVQTRNQHLLLNYNADSRWRWFVLSRPTADFKTYSLLHWCASLTGLLHLTSYSGLTELYVNQKDSSGLNTLSTGCFS